MSPFLSRYYLYFTILKYEEVLKNYGFNKVFLTPEKVIMMIEVFGVKVIEDKTFPAPFLLVKNNKNGNGSKEKILVYNPHSSPERLVHSLGHELGHLILGDYEDLKLEGINGNLKIHAKSERDADIIGYLCWIPTSYFLSFDKIVDEEFFLKDLQNCDTDFQFLHDHLPARLRILRSFYKVHRKLEEFNKKFAIEASYLNFYLDYKKEE